MATPNSLDLTYGASITKEQITETYHRMRAAAFRVYRCDELAELDEETATKLLADLKNVLNMLGLTEFLEIMLEAEEIE